MLLSYYGSALGWHMPKHMSRRELLSITRLLLGGNVRRNSKRCGTQASTGPCKGERNRGLGGTVGTHFTSFGHGCSVFSRVCAFNASPFRYPRRGCHDSSHGSRSRPHHSHSERTRFRAFRRGSLESFQVASAVVLAPKTSSRFEVFFRMVRSSKSCMGLKKRAVTGIRMGLLSIQKSPVSSGGIHIIRNRGLP